jgi:uncharacterized protein YfaS (alpha-2-macroglobulin family)
LSFRNHPIPPSERKFSIRNYRNPRLNIQIEFLNKGYTSGETVKALISAQRAEGGPASSATVRATSRVDSNEIARVEKQLDENGNALIEFKLPDSIETGDGTLSIVVEDGGVIESSAKSIPITLQVSNKISMDSLNEMFSTEH